MSKPQRMLKVQITGPKSQLEKTIRTLHKQKVIHILDHAKTEEIDIGAPLESAQTLSEVLVKLRSVASYLKVGNAIEPNVHEFNTFIHEKGISTFEQIGKTTRELFKIVSEKIEARVQKRDEIKKLKDNIKKLEILKALKIPKSAFQEFSSIGYCCGFVAHPVSRKELDQITTRYNLYSAIHEKTGLACIFTDKEFLPTVQAYVNKKGYRDVDLITDFKGTVDDEMQRLKEEVNNIEDGIDSINESLESISGNWCNFLVVSISLLETQVEKAEAPLKFASSKNLFVITGWVPEARFDNMSEQLMETADQKLYIKKIGIDNADNIPISLSNAPIARPFQFFLDLYTYPKYGEFDPSLIIFLTFPIFYGFMLGDMGYGITTLIFFLILRKIMKSGTALIDVLIYSSLSTIVFGALFGEFFGAEVLFGVELPNIFHALHLDFTRPHALQSSHAIQFYMMMAIAMGVIHVNIGLIMGFINVWRAHGFKHAFLEKISWMLLELSAAILAVSYLAPGFLAGYGIVQIYGIIAGWALLVITVVLLYLGEGVKGLIELPSIFGNILSYLRLMAIGLASVALAIVVNEFTGQFFEKGSYFIIIAVLIFIVGHVINIGLGILGPFLHSLRLTYVEFFSKFYEGGGQIFKPFGLKQWR